MLRDGGSLCCGVYENVFLNRVETHPFIKIVVAPTS